MSTIKEKSKKLTSLKLSTGKGPYIVQQDASTSGWGETLLDNGELYRYALGV